MTATFGTLHNQTLELKDGLNLIQAPNETGKSTWCAFLLAMLYGINSRERDKAGFIAEKNRYAPWDGMPMAGRLDCSFGGRDITITRTTKRSAAPMGDFQAVYTGTAETVPELSGQDCGEALLGISREVFERSAFIRQSGLAISQDAGLERRIASLITSGEEGVSYSEAADVLKRQLNRRRHNRTGQLPTLESERSDTQIQLDRVDALSSQLSAQRVRAEECSRREQELAHELSSHDRWESAQKRIALQSAEAAAQSAQQSAAQAQQRAAAEQLPENETIARLRGAIVNLETTRRACESARDERDEALKEVLRAENAIGKSPFAGQTAEDVRKELSAPPKAAISVGPSLAVFFGGLFLAAALAVFCFSRFSAALTGWQRLLPWAVFAVITAPSYAVSHQMRRHAAAAARSASLTKRYGTDSESEIQALADTYLILLDGRNAAQTAAGAKSAAYDALYASLSSNEQGILLEVRRFAPAAFDIPAADQALRECAQRRKALSDTQLAAREAQMRLELLRQQIRVEAEEDDGPVLPPRRSREAVTAELEQSRAEAAEIRSAVDRLTGQLHAAGDPLVLRAQDQQLSEQICRLEQEYAAILLAQQALDRANTALQNRFSPELGRRAAEIFQSLAGEQYRGVTLDRAFHLSVERSDSPLSRDAALLSAGALDQLYLATRLAICDLVLPGENEVPLFLDDALANFDNERCAAALRWLRQEARRRQILLFTCHTREAEFFRGDTEVSLQELTRSE